MIDLLKQTLLAGIGAGVVTAEKVEDILQDLDKKGKLSAEDAQATAAKIAEDGKEEFNKSKNTLTNLFEEMLTKANLAKNSDLQKLEARIAALEAQLATAPVTEE